jgi:hypothetical protein
VSMLNIHNTMQAAYQRRASRKRPRCENTPRPREFSRLLRSSILIDRTFFQPSKAPGSAADLDRVNVPTGARMHAPPPV